MAMSLASRSEPACLVDKAERELQALISESEKEICIVSRGFSELASDTDAILRLAGAIAGCVEDERVLSVLPKVQSLGTAAKVSIGARLEATTGILEIVSSEAKLLERISTLTRNQRSIARETQTLSVLTNIEVARLGKSGSGFQYLAHELDEFSQSVVKSSKEVTSHTDERKASIEEAKRMLAAGLPRIRQQFARIEFELSGALAAVEAGQNQLLQAPVLFRGCVEEIAGQIAGVVTAVQGHDITRQQIEHVQEALRLIAVKLKTVEEASGGQNEAQTAAPDDAQNASHVAAGLLIQIYQLRSIQGTVSDWLEQIRLCTDGIMRISSSELVGIGPIVLEQESKLSAQLAQIEALELQCQTGNEEVQATFTGLSSLMELVGEHLTRSRAVRERMQLLTFNSIVEASHLGSRADAILEISQSIKRISTSWSEMTDRSAQTMDEILGMVEQVETAMQAFSSSGKEELDEARAETRVGLEALRSAAAFASGHAAEIESSTAKLQSRLKIVGEARERLDNCFARIGAVLEGIEELGREWETGHPEALARCNRPEVEEMFSASYTTEMERLFLRAALYGEPLPEADQILAGNDVELF
jgi:methyl-accepting chemotaxis protein